MKPRRIPLSPKAMSELANVQMLNDIIASLEYILPVFNESIGQIEPKAEFLRDGMLAYADGTNWDPGDGKGLYRYDADTPEWVLIG